MRIEELEQALDRYGGDPARWPADVREAALKLIADDRQAAALVDAQDRLDAALAETVQPVAVDAALLGRIASGMHGHDVALRPTRRFAAFAAVAMTAFLVTGYAIGLALPTSQGEDTIAGLMFGNSSASFSSSGSAL